MEIVADLTDACCTDHYGEQLAKVMNKMVLVGEVGFLAKRCYKSHASMRQGAPEAAK